MTTTKLIGSTRTISSVQKKRRTTSVAIDCDPTDDNQVGLVLTYSEWEVDGANNTVSGPQHFVTRIPWASMPTAAKTEAASLVTRADNYIAGL